MSFEINKSKCKKCAKSLRAGKGLIKKEEDGYYIITRNPQNDVEMNAMIRACELCPFGAIIRK